MKDSIKGTTKTWQKTGVFLIVVKLSFSLQVRWYRNTMLLAPNENRLVQQFGIRHQLVVHEAGQADFGNYSCRAENQLGRARAFVEVSGE